MLNNQHRTITHLMHMKRLRAGICALSLIPSFARAARAQDSANVISAAEVQQLVKFDTLWLNLLRRRNARDYAITTPNGIQEDRYITLGGIEQWISIRGEDRSNPVILLVHGGPGDATSLYGYALLRSWFKRFTVVQWDQRGAGRTYGRNGPSTPMVTIDRIVHDGIELSDSLRRALKKDKIIVVGPSFGSIVGLEMGRARSGLFYAFTGTGQIGAPADTTLAAAYRLVLASATRRGERVAVRELTEIGPPPWRDGRAYGIEHKWTNLLEHIDTFLNATLSLGLTAPGATIGDLNGSFDGEAFSGDKLVPHLNEIDPALFRGTFSVPIFVIQGADDLTSPPSLARAFVGAIRAPKKEFVLVPGGGHFALFTRPDAFLEELSARVGFAK
jgi:pimeloyl-ACP methyl ester carboxylesterase